jgi:SAM-dependent methyltransferase
VRRVEQRVLAGRGILGNRYVSAKLLPLGEGEPHAVVTREGATARRGDLLLPPERLRRRWASDADAYLEGGRRDVERLLATLRGVGVAEDSIGRVLDFGCAEGRMLRHLWDRSDRELWGVDINAERITWCQQHLAPPIRFATTTTAPHLPFVDGYFDLVYALSVFTHITELADAWFLELLRVLRPGGHAYLTIHDEHSIDVLLGRAGAAHVRGELTDMLLRFDDETGTLASDWISFALYADPGAHVFHRRDDLVRRWAQLAELRTVEEEAADYQTALLFAKGP